MHRFAQGQPHVVRNVSLEGQDQRYKRTTKKLDIQAAPLPDLSDAKPRPDKGIEGLVTVVMHPLVRFQDADEIIEIFDPPLELDVEYTQADVQATTLDDKGAPRLSLCLGYPTEQGWKWERLKTRVTPSSDSAGTLHAQVRTLHPQDPVWIGRP